MKDIIRLNQMSFYGYHGVSAAEKETGRVFEVDCELEVDLAEPGHSDRLRDTIDYTEVHGIIKETVEGTAFSLVEALASALADKLLDSFPAYRVTLRVRKLNPPIPGHVKNIEVEITRHQKDVSRFFDSQSEPKKK
ncbi:MAG TPA: dihydroneopterin aldolase [candidate division Zixibacteria bacterium]|nr:dihydroneopterin aldolase [candidate division Zixibacteria bacterium]